MNFRHIWQHPWRWLVTRLAYLWFRVACRGEIANQQYIEMLKPEGFVLFSNHVSYLDWLVLWAYLQIHHDITPKFVAKEKLFTHPIWSTVVSCSCCIKVADSGDGITATEYRKIKKTKYVVIFPEGARSRTGEVGDFRAGAIKIASRLEKKLLPVALVGFFEAWPPNSKLPRPNKCHIRFGESICPNKSPDDPHELRREVVDLLESPPSPSGVA